MARSFETSQTRSVRNSFSAVGMRVPVMTVCVRKWHRSVHVGFRETPPAHRPLSDAIYFSSSRPILMCSDWIRDQAAQEFSSRSPGDWSAMLRLAGTVRPREVIGLSRQNMGLASELHTIASSRNASEGERL